jgi:DNA-directed RNA polymerase specialized sigma24 family protein
VTAEKAEKAKEQSKSNQRYRHKDFENVLAVMLKRKATLQEVCMTKNLPSKGTALHYAESNPDFRKKMLETYHALPYAVQARANMLSPSFFEELTHLKGKGLNAAEIARELQVSRKTVVRHLKDLKQS